MYPNKDLLISPGTRVKLWYGALLLVLMVFAVRLFYLQIIRHDYYVKAASSSQLKEYEIQAERGVIEAYSGDTIVPIVLNEKRFTLFADPKHVNNKELVDDIKEAAKLLANATDGNADDYHEKMQSPGRYVILAKKLTKEQNEAVLELGIKGVGTREESIRTYPQGQLAAQVLGFVNDEGAGTYGVEQYLDDALKGSPGRLKAITDASGVPLVSNESNIVEAPSRGERVGLTIDIALQGQVEEILKSGLEQAKATSGGAVILEANSGAVRAIANYPSYNPSEFYNVESKDIEVFQNSAVSSPLEVGSIMKPLTMAAALNDGAVSANSSYFDSGAIKIDDATVTNVEEVGGSGTRSMEDILVLSLNTGATYLLQQMGGGEINERARKTWHDYMTNRFRLGRETGIEQGYEAAGVIPDPLDGFGLNIRFANTAFGQGMTATPLQMAAAIASVLNGGTYYRPTLVDRVGGEKQTPEILRTDVVTPEVAETVSGMMQEVVRSNNRSALRQGYEVGGKTGTAQIARPEGGYYKDKYNGMYMGFVGGERPEYVIVVRVNEPKIAGYAGSRAAGPIFSSLSNMIIDSYGVNPGSP